MSTTPPPPPPPPPPTADPAAGPGPEPDPDPDSGPRVSGAQARDLGRLRRTAGPDRYVAGVAGGLARHLDIDPVLVRVTLVVLAFFGGAGLLLYAVAWLVVPEDGAPSAPLALDERSRTVALVLTGALAVLALLGDTWGPGFFPWPLLLVALVAYLLLRRRDRHRPPPGAAPAEYPAEYPATAYGTTAHPPAAPVVPPPDPRRRGPGLFAGTLALAAFGVGLLGLVDVAGVGVPDAGYPALVLAVVAAGLVLGAFWGRAGGLIALGLVAAVALLATSAADRFEGERVTFAPDDAASVRSAYDAGVGDYLLDLTGVADPEALDGRTISVDGEVGQIRVLVPEELDVDVRADVHGPGAIETFGTEEGGFDRSRSDRWDGGADAPSLTLDLELEVGRIEVGTR